MEKLSYAVWQTFSPEDQFYKVGLPGHKFHVIVEDGYPVWKVWDNDTLVLPSGKRFDVLVTATGNGSIPLKAINSPFVIPYGNHNCNCKCTR